jgi:hypothetical protein
MIQAQYSLFVQLEITNISWKDKSNNSKEHTLRTASNIIYEEQKHFVEKKLANLVQVEYLMCQKMTDCITLVLGRNVYKVR